MGVSNMGLFEKEKQKKQLYRKKDGKYEYIGNLRRHTGSEAELKKTKLILWLCAAPALICAIASGCIPATGMVDNLFVLIPFAVGICVLLFLCARLAEFTLTGSEIREELYEKCVPSFGAQATVIEIAAFITAAAEIIRFFVSSGTVSLSSTLIVAGLQLMTAGLCMIFARKVSGMDFELVHGSAASN